MLDYVLFLNLLHSTSNRRNEHSKIRVKNVNNTNNTNNAPNVNSFNKAELINLQEDKELDKYLFLFI